ncbi:MAG TPA: HAD-IC family P-type ATPase, partial [Longilinea sp.]|nr:HAD-IC family P-type ATPase [Longilinea sp.]
MTKIDVSNKERFYKLKIDEVYEALGTSEGGLTQTEAQARLKQFGYNAIEKVRGKPLWIKFLANFTHLMAILLWVAGIASLIGQMPQLAIAIWLVNVINGAFSFWQEFRAEKATEALKKLLPSYARVLRDGAEQKILSEELVPGDVILLGEGDSVSADCRLVTLAELHCDQSTLTGESRPVSKSTAPVLQEGLTYTEVSNLVFAGTHVASGTGKAVVFATGMHTEFGNIAHLTQEVGEELSPLQKEMVVVTRLVTIIALLVGVVFYGMAVLLAKVSLAEGFIFSIGMVVAFVPEGMLPLVTLSLALGTQRMAKRHALIKKLSAVETLGCTTVICTDKTGTLTQNEMTVKSIWLPGVSEASAGRNLKVTGVGYAPEGAIKEDNGKRLDVKTDADLRRVLLAAGMCNNSRLLPPGSNSNGDEKKSKSWTILGDPTEAALLVVAYEGGLDLQAEERSCPRVRELPFESRRKRMSTIHLLSGAHEIAFVKGAPKEVMELSTHIQQKGIAQSITDNWREAIMAANDEMARNGLRVLAIAQRDLPSDMQNYTPETVETGLTFLGLMAMMDPPRPEVTNAVEKCRQAGIRVVMITGDYGLTAESIARRIGIVKGDHPRIVTGFD